MEYRISKSKLMELLVAELRLEALEEHGVDNWGCYGDFDMFDGVEEIEAMAEEQSLEFLEELGYVEV
jgi:hypothetical protein